MVDISELVRQVAGQVKSANTEVIFGETRTFQDVSVIPVAKLSYGVGGGGGGGAGDGEHVSAGSGGGGGLGVRAKPMGYLLIEPSGVRYEPIIDKTMVVLAGTILGSLIGALVVRTVRTYLIMQG